MPKPTFHGSLCIATFHEAINKKLETALCATFYKPIKKIKKMKDVE